MTGILAVPLVQWDSIPESSDIVVVGGGLTGLEIAKQLDESGRASVVVLEAGPAVDFEHVHAANDAKTADHLWYHPLGDRYFSRPWTSQSEPHFSGKSGIRRRLGGRSLYWHGVMLPIESWALREPWWPKSMIRDLTVSWLGGPSLYERVSRELAAWSGTHLPHSVSPAEHQELHLGQRILAQTPQAVRYSYVDGELRWGAYTPLHYWLTTREGLTSGKAPSTMIVPDVEVLGVSVKRDEVSGLVIRNTASGARKEISCGSVVLAAGTIENARIAIQALSLARKISEQYLSGLVDHLVQGFLVAMNPRGIPEPLLALAQQNAFFFMPCKDEARSNLFVALRTTMAGSFVLDVWATGEQLPSAEGMIECASSAEWPWPVQVRTGLSQADRQVIDAQRQELQEFWNDFCETVRQPRSQLDFPDFWAPTRTLTDAYLGLETLGSDSEPVAWASPLGTEDHEGGTIALGRVLDERHEFVDIRRLFAAGPSTFPRMGAANPSLTSLALARRLAGMLSG